MKIINVSHVKKLIDLYLFFFFTRSQLIMPADSLFVSELEKSKD